MFQTKTFNSIVASMINRVTAGNSTLTDFNPGSVLRTLIESVASEIDEYYQALLKGFYEAVPVAIYKTFSFGRLAAAAATGYVTFTREAGIVGALTVPAGTQVSTSGGAHIYTVQNAYTMPAGVNTVLALVKATTTGIATNCGASAIAEIVDSVYGVASVSNADAFLVGRDEETDAERKLRFQQWLVTLARSTKEAIEYGARSVQLVNSLGNVTERVTQVLVHEPCVDADPIGDPGYVDIYLWNGTTGASAELLAETHKILFGYTNDAGEKISGWKAAGIIVSIFAVESDSVDVTATITLDGTRVEADVDDDVAAAIAAVFSELTIGGGLVWAKLLHGILGVQGIADIALSAPAANVDAVAWNRILSPGTVTITYA